MFENEKFASICTKSTIGVIDLIWSEFFKFKSWCIHLKTSCTGCVISFFFLCFFFFMCIFMLAKCQPHFSLFSFIVRSLRLSHVSIYGTLFLCLMSCQALPFSLVVSCVWICVCVVNIRRNVWTRFRWGQTRFWNRVRQRFRTRRTQCVQIRGHSRQHRVKCT